MSGKDGQESVVAAQEPLGTEAADAGHRDEKETNRGNKDTKVGLTLRILVSVYVLYLAYGLIKGFGETSGNERIFIGAAIVVFLVAGGAILFFSGKKLIRKEYRDADESPKSTEDEEKSKKP